MKAVLLLEDGTTFEGISIGAPGTVVGEVVFDTSMIGYQEKLTDPSYAGQLITLTYPLIGNYGVNDADQESERFQAKGLIVHQLCDKPSNWRSNGSLADYLQQNGAISIEGIDTRALTRHLRMNGVMMGAISTELTRDELKNALQASPVYGDINYVEQLSAGQVYECPCSSPQAKYHVAIIDLGVPRSMLNQFSQSACNTTVLPHDTSAEAVLDLNPDLVVFSSGPGDPRLLSNPLETMHKLIGKMPIWGIGLGHQLLSIAMGGHINKLKYGHRGANHPVKNLVTGKVSITTQNHGFAVDAESLSDQFEVTAINLNDGTIEGLRHKNLPILSIQYAPEPQLFEEYLESVAAPK
ncbi:MAG: glutamine-hydrolyzing carbamoyl-phosphate synthase small subunit [Armatimonadota bacterium]